jgi:hypothetical protein
MRPEFDEHDLPAEVEWTRQLKRRCSADETRICVFRLPIGNQI